MKLSVKLRITLWFAAAMTLLAAISVAGILFTGSYAVRSSAEELLKAAVETSFEDISYKFGSLDTDDLDYYRDGVSLAVYGSDGGLLYGHLPTGFDPYEPLNVGHISTVEKRGSVFYVYDAAHYAGHGVTVTVRGVVSAKESSAAFSALIKTALLALPTIVLLAAVGGYLLSRSALMPVKRITETAKRINGGKDLSLRIGGKGGKGDELEELSSTFDGMFDRLEESFENEKRFVSDASHELRTPLAVIMSECDAGLTEGSSEAEKTRALSEIKTECKKMTSLVSSLLMLSRADRSHDKLKYENVAYSELCEIVAEETKERAAAKSIGVTADIEEGVTVRGDETMLIRMMLNLTENAVKYGKDGGSIKIKLFKEGESAVFVCDDDGCGMTEEQVSGAFLRFYRADSSRSTEGFGLGLPLVQYIARAHGGDAFIESKENVGTKVSVSIPSGGIVIS